MCVVREGEGVEVTQQRRAGQKEARYRLSPRFTCGVWRDLGEVEAGKGTASCMIPRLSQDKVPRSAPVNFSLFLTRASLRCVRPEMW